MCVRVGLFAVLTSREKSLNTMAMSKFFRLNPTRSRLITCAGAWYNNTHVHTHTHAHNVRGRATLYLAPGPFLTGALSLLVCVPADCGNSAQQRACVCVYVCVCVCTRHTYLYLT